MGGFCEIRHQLKKLLKLKNIQGINFKKNEILWGKIVIWQQCKNVQITKNVNKRVKISKKM